MVIFITPTPLKGASHSHQIELLEKTENRLSLDIYALKYIEIEYIKFILLVV